MTIEKINEVHFREQIDNIFKKECTILSKNTKLLINKIVKNEIEVTILINIVIERIKVKENHPSILDGFIYQQIITKSSEKSKKYLIKYLPNGIINIKTSTNINYITLENLLINEKFEEADKLTQKYLCQLVSNKTQQEKNWLYFTDIQFLQKKDLYTIDLLWRIYSQGKFGFSIQKKLWIQNKKKWDVLWEKIRWANNGIMKRYPKEFIWTINAVEGHLPLFNQLRGTQTLACLFKKIEW